MANNFSHIINLARLNSNVYYLFYIACFGLILASPSLKDLRVVPVFLLGSIAIRSAGCIINDIFDRNFDRYVERTKSRPLARRVITVKFALQVLAFFLTVSLLLMLTLSRVAIYLSLMSLVMIICYPLFKRSTYFPQVFLGLTYSIGCLIGYATIANNISLAAFIMYIASGLWVVGFDTIYGCMDIEDDKKINIKSMAILLENHHLKIWLAGFYLGFITLFLLSYYMMSSELKTHLYLLCGTIVALTMLMWQVITLNITSPENCLQRFKSNNYVGLTLVIALLINKHYT